DYLSFIRLVRNKSVRLVHVNPSLVPASILRDSIYVFLARLYSKKTFVFFHGWDRDFAETCGQGFWGLFLRRILKADAIAVLANEFKSKLLDWEYKGKILNETMLVGETLFNYEISEAVDKNTNSPKVLFLSRIEETKGIYQTIDACKILRGKYSGLKLIVAGNGSIEKQVRDQCSGEEWIEFTGYVRGEQKKELYYTSDLYLFPTYYPEGMPNSVLEAMATGLPVVTRPVGGLADFFDTDKMGALTDSLDPEVIAAECDRLLADPAKMNEISLYNIQYAHDRFLVSNVARRLVSIYNSLIEEKQQSTVTAKSVNA
ncbi:MAG: glycosyltransferase family 4 protein, partial [Calditrichota bacterium]